MKNLNKILIIILTIGCANQTYAQKKELMPIQEIREIIELALNLPELQYYYHIDTIPERLPIKFKEFGLINSKNMKGLTKFNDEILFLSEIEINGKNIKDYFNVGDWTYGGNSLRLQLDYVIEGILINYRFIKTEGVWNIENFVIFEN